ncbi:MAG TPA: PHP domain-containing protein, partial [Myxococcales bacterium]|nr:PHP domain-containing protein [Myxococcales bacterium]
MHSRNWISGCLPLAMCAGILLSGCAEDESLLRAKQVENPHELIGGPLAHGEVGDYLIENDQVRFIISGAHHSWGPGLLGGTVVDADLRRSEPEFRGGRGKDQFSELFPTVNLLVADPSISEIRVLSDGKDGKEAAIEVTGRGSFYIDAMSFLDVTKETSYSFFLQSQNLMAILDFATVYRLVPGT